MSGAPRIRLRIRPLTGWGSRVPERAIGSNHARYYLQDWVLRMTTDAPLPLALDEHAFLLDREINMVLGPDETLPQGVDIFVREQLDQTLGYWREWVRNLSIPVDWQEAVIRSAITLKLCQYEGSGAIVAAMTTSIPEHADSGRNWDYRYCWLRDAAFVVRALEPARRDPQHGAIHPLHLQHRRRPQGAGAGVWHPLPGRTARAKRGIAGRLPRHGSGAGRQRRLAPGPA